MKLSTAIPVHVQDARGGQTITMSNDLISRQAAIDALMEILDRPKHAEFLYTDEICRALNELPSATSEIIHCGDCWYKDDGIDEDGIPFLKCLNGRSYGGTRINDFCSWAERRIDGRD